MCIKKNAGNRFSKHKRIRGNENDFTKVQKQVIVHINSKVNAVYGMNKF